MLSFVPQPQATATKGTIMEKEVARQILEEVDEFRKPFNKITEVAFLIQDVEKQKKIRRALANAYNELFEGIVVPIGEEYPDLYEKYSKQ